MYALNRVQIIGHLTQAPEVRQTPTGQMVGDLNVVTKQMTVRQDGSRQILPSYHSVVVWRGLAEIADRFLKKGSQVYISGKLQTDSWDDPEGQKRYKTRLVADEMIMLDSKIASAQSAASSEITSGLNQVELIGNLTKDPELRQTPNGNSVCNFSVATNFTWKARTGEQQERTEFHNVVAWDTLSQSIGQSFKKGRKVYISGRIQTRSWETPDGKKRWTTEIVADKALLLGLVDSEFGAPESAGASQVTFSEPKIKQTAGVIPDNPVEVPAINYEPDIRPEDLPF
ncbi:single-stranded DNA-binding protein [Candidatus Peregrinibacteria bacterium]|nr:MAG: single-stranded DNA-binding protein [Candidatus Peregrinibacteria bacterium]